MGSSFQGRDGGGKGAISRSELSSIRAVRAEDANCDDPEGIKGYRKGILFSFSKNSSRSVKEAGREERWRCGTTEIGRVLTLLRVGSHSLKAFPSVFRPYSSESLSFDIGFRSRGCMYIDSD